MCQPFYCRFIVGQWRGYGQVERHKRVNDLEVAFNTNKKCSALSFQPLKCFRQLLQPLEASLLLIRGPQVAFFIGGLAPFGHWLLSI